jgi:hypothetical protein
MNSLDIKIDSMIKDYEFNLGDNAPKNEKSWDFSDKCYICARKLGANPHYFEVNTSWILITPDGTYKDSQGQFPVGKECAKKFSPDLLFREEK